MRLARRYQEADLGHTKSGVEIGERALDRADVGTGRLVVHALAPLQRGEQRAGVGELRHHLGIGIGRGLDPRKAELGEALDQGALGLRRHEVGFVLQPVAGKAFAQDDIAHRAAPASAPAASRLNARIACWRSAFFCTLPLAVMPMASKLVTIAR